ncbi:ferritin-like domain-containing protein [Azospirillum sp. B4]|uniref:ferritin-like domain-containing protein n=1 Tax=Azospirillum sp. B4 TaxID=95605 RepID=UPI002078CC72|nr:ferritin-like domain-containing protein [Azospirillum sp. B4]
MAPYHVPAPMPADTLEPFQSDSASESFPLPPSLAAAAVRVLTTAAPAEKVRLTRGYAAAWRAGQLPDLPGPTPPDRPARPARPELKMPRDMPKRRKAGSVAGRVALLHALAHIELNAIDLAWDIIARFPAFPDGTPAPRAFKDDWVRVADEEAKHHDLLAGRLATLSASYGDLPAHDGLWQASEVTAHDLAARLALVPMVLEARGLDVTPGMIANLKKVGDEDSTAVLQIIHDEEIGHVAAGRHWFGVITSAAGDDPAERWRALVRRYFKGEIKRPFNDASRIKADFPPDWYEPLAPVDAILPGLDD